jgi:hypothetical protein
MASYRFMNWNAIFTTHRPLPFNQVHPIADSCSLSPPYVKRIERRLLTEPHKNTKADLSIDVFFFSGSTAPSWPRHPKYQGFTIILRHTTFGRTPLDKRSACRRELTTHNTQNRQKSKPLARIEPATTPSKRLQPHALDRAVIQTGPVVHVMLRSVLNATRNFPVV